MARVCAWLGLFVMVASVVSTASAAAPDWPQWRGLNRDGKSPDTGLAQEWPEGGPPLAWKATGIGKGYASAAVTGGKIYTMGDRQGSEWIICLDLANQKELWAAKVGQPYGDGGPRCTPTVDGDLVYAISPHGDLVCVEAASGKEVWRKKFDKDFGGKMMSQWSYSESPLVDGEKLVCTPGGKDAVIVALNKKTGETIWKCAMPDIGPKGKDGAGYSSIIISEAGGVKQYVTLMGRGLIGAAAKDGKFLWGYNKVANGTANIMTAIVSGDYVFDSSAYGTGAALLKLSADSGGGVKAEEVYFLGANTFQNHHGGVVLVGDYLYGGHGQNDGTLKCIELKTGKIAWQIDKGVGGKSAAVTFADGNLYVRYESGLMALVAATPEGFKLKGSFQLPVVTGPSWPHTTIQDRKLFVRDNDTLMCYDIAKK
ncbi:MAG: PQQ-like beta-propeller repeat protein [Planctomycetota bacterium]|nr:PQQ-like beta-propeller repeat protein [Planctomycetota bacterium]